MFKLGDRIVQKCKLEAAVYTSEPKMPERDVLTPIICYLLPSILETGSLPVHLMLTLTALTANGRQETRQHRLPRIKGRRRCLA